MKNSGPGLVKEHCRLLIDRIREKNLLSGFTRALVVSDNAASVSLLFYENHIQIMLRSINPGRHSATFVITKAGGYQ